MHETRVEYHLDFGYQCRLLDYQITKKVHFYVTIKMTSGLLYDVKAKKEKEFILEGIEIF